MRQIVPVGYAQSTPVGDGAHTVTVTDGAVDSDGLFRTSWHKDIGSGSFLAEVESLALLGYLEDLDLYYWVDEDGDGLPDRILNR